MIITILFSSLVQEVSHAASANCPGIPATVMTGKISKFASSDPHGLILSAVSISVVFLSLILLWLLFSGLFREKKNGNLKEIGEEEASAIAAALQEYDNEEEIIAIVKALHDYDAGEVHDKESFKITIIRNEYSEWNNNILKFRQIPR